MNKLSEVLSPIQRRETERRLQTTLKRRGNIARGKGVAPGTLRKAEVARSTALKRLGPTGRAAKTQAHLTHKPGQGATNRALQQRLAAGTELNWKNKLFETLLEWMSDEDKRQYKGRHVAEPGGGHHPTLPPRGKKKTSKKKAKKKKKATLPAGLQAAAELGKGLSIRTPVKRTKVSAKEAAKQTRDVMRGGK